MSLMSHLLPAEDPRHQRGADTGVGGWHVLGIMQGTLRIGGSESPCLPTRPWDALPCWDGGGDQHRVVMGDQPRMSHPPCPACSGPKVTLLSGNCLPHRAPPPHHLIAQYFPWKEAVGKHDEGGQGGTGDGVCLAALGATKEGEVGRAGGGSHSLRPFGSGRAAAKGSPWRGRSGCVWGSLAVLGLDAQPGRQWVPVGCPTRFGGAAVFWRSPPMTKPPEPPP